ncbi:MAG: alpha/beta hydrolase [Actinomycetales bacterium]|nr:alpha/beta hydrolase [Actinomycetales bacterium]
MSESSELLEAWPHQFRQGVQGAPVLLLLHGTGGNEEEIMGLAAHLDPEATILAPRGRVTEQGMNRWFRRLGEGNFDVDDVIVQAAELAEFIEAARAHYGLDDQRLVAVGFSNGANIGLATALLHPTALARVVALSGMYPFGDRDPLAAEESGGESAEESAEESAGDVSTVSLLLLNGSSDPMAPAASVRRLEAVATSHGVSVERHERAGGHGIDASELETARSWIHTRPI